MNEENLNNNEIENTSVQPEETVQPAVEESVAETTPVVEEQPIQPTEPVQPAVESAPVEPTKPEPIQPVESVATPPIQPIEDEPKKKKSILPVLIIIVVLAALCGASYYFLVVNTNNPIYNFFFNKSGNTGTNTTTKAAGELKEIKYADPDGIYYADKIYLQDGNLYVLPDAATEVTIPTDAKEIDGAKVLLVKDNVKEAMLLEWGQAEFEELIVIDNDGKAYIINNLPITANDGKKPFQVDEIKDVKNVAKGISLAVLNGYGYILLNDRNQIVYGSSDAYSTDKTEYVYFDNKNKNGFNVRPDGTMIELKTGEVDNDQVYFDVIVNGSEYKLEGIAKPRGYIGDGELNDVELFAIPVCGSGDSLAFGQVC